MKTKPILIAALLAAALPGGASASPMSASGSSKTQTERRDDSSIYQRVLRFPGHVVYSVARTPLIIGETAMGQRRIISRGGFFAADEEQRHSLTMRRVAFEGDAPDND
ncbi:MAG: hypothetical protein WCF18_01300 [Chthoniobacteraceae bacterium]